MEPDMSVTPGASAIPAWLLTGIAIILSASVGWLDFHATEVQPAVLLLLVITGALSFAAPNNAWLWALIMGLSVEGTYLVASAMGMTPRDPMTPAAGGLLALIPAAIGAACGAGARAALRSGLAR